MACRYYDDLIVEKLQRWLPDQSNLRVLKPDETKRLFELKAEDSKDQPLKLPLLAVSRNTDIELLSNVKSPKSYDGVRLFTNNTHTSDISAGRLGSVPATTALFNVLPIKLQYQLDIYTKTAEEGDEYVRTFLFKLINNPVIKVLIPYNEFNVEHIANIRVLNQVSDTSAISERLFTGQFTRWTIQLEIQDAFLFSIPYKRNWVLAVDDDVERNEVNLASTLEVYEADRTRKVDEKLPILLLKKEKN